MEHFIFPKLKSNQLCVPMRPNKLQSALLRCATVVEEPAQPGGAVEVRQDERARESGGVEFAAGRRHRVHAQVVVAAAGGVGEEARLRAGEGADWAGAGRSRRGQRGGDWFDAAAGVLGRRAHSSLGAELETCLAGANYLLDQGAGAHAHIEPVADS